MKSPPAVRVQQLAKAMKLDQFFQSRGMTADQVQACLANVDGIQKLEAGTNAAQQQYNVTGTPTFLHNGQEIGRASSRESEGQDVLNSEAAVTTKHKNI